MPINRTYQRTKGNFQGVPSKRLPVLQIQRVYTSYNYHSDDVHGTLTGKDQYYFRTYSAWSVVSVAYSQVNGYFYKSEYFYILFYFIPLWLGNSACFDIDKIFFRPCLDWRVLL
jgi:hypothetical protein